MYDKIMKVGMLFPDKKTEKGIAIYSENLISAIKKNEVKIETINYKRGSLLSLLKTISKLRKFDLIHIQHENRLFGPIDGIWFAPFMLLLGFLKKGKFIMTFHNVHTKEEKLFSLHPILNYIKRYLTHPLNYLFADFFSEAIIVHTNFLKKDLIKSSTIKPSKIIVIPQGVNNRKKIFNKEKARKKLNLNLIKPVYLLIGNMGPNKGFDIIIKQAKKINGIILVVGDDSNTGRNYVLEMKKIVNGKKLNKLVKFDIKEGINANEDIWWIYLSATDLVLLPYRVMTTSGIFIDAIEAGKPVVGCNSKYFKEISKKYSCIKIAKNEEDYPRVIEEAIKDLKKMEFEAKRFAKNNNILLIAKHHKKIYSSLLKR